MQKQNDRTTSNRSATSLHYQRNSVTDAKTILSKPTKWLWKKVWMNNMKCLLCEKKGTVRPEIYGSLTLCNEHYGLLSRVQEQQEKRVRVRERITQRRVEIENSRFNKNRTRRATTMMIENGSIKKKPCEVCGNEKVDTHHDDYNDPEKVRFLCRKHHAEHHKKHKI